MQVDEGRFFLFRPEDNERTILGCTFHVPLWLATPSVCFSGSYEFTEKQLILSYDGGSFDLKDARQGKVRRHLQTKVYLERQ